jgi:hypothetical protein
VGSTRRYGEDTKLLTLLNQYKLSLVDTDIENISIIDNLAFDPSLKNLKNTLLNKAIIFQKNEPGKEFIQALSELCNTHQTFIYWNKIKDSFHAGHLSQQFLDRYQSAKDIGIELPPSTPGQTIKPNLRMFKEYRSALKPEYHPHANAMIEHLDKISFSELKVLVKKLAHKLNQHVQEKQYSSVCIFYRGKKKSEYWLLQLIYPFLNFTPTELIEIYDDYDFSSDKNQATILKLQNALHSKNSCLLFIDDGTYSDTQCFDHLVHIAYRLNHIHQKQPEYFNESSIELVFAFTYATQ